MYYLTSVTHSSTPRTDQVTGTIMVEPMTDPNETTKNVRMSKLPLALRPIQFVMDVGKDMKGEEQSVPIAPTLIIIQPGLGTSLQSGSS